MGAVEKDIILYVISLAQVASMGGIVSPGQCFNSWGVGWKFETCKAVDEEG